MRIIDCDKGEQSQIQKPVSIALGNFDGLHLGHQALIKKSKEVAIEKGYLSGVLLFKNHTLSELKNKDLQLLTSLADKEELLDNLGVDVIYLKSFDHKFCSINKLDFIEDVLTNQLKVKAVTIGHDYRFGCWAEGKVSDLIANQTVFDYEVFVIDDVVADGERISSSRIRQTLRDGNVENATKMLGRPFRIGGEIVPGANRGRKLGFRTANLFWDHHYIVPRDGVYLTRVYLDDLKTPHHYGMTNIGTNPTFTEANNTKIETHIFDIDGDLYGKRMWLEFLAYERGDIKFDTVGELVDVMKEDERILRSWIPQFEK